MQARPTPTCFAALVKFSGEEAYGRFLDLHELHTVFINLKGMPVRCDACCRREPRGCRSPCIWTT